MQRHRKTIAAIGLAAASCAALAACSSSNSNAGLNQPAPTTSASTTSATSATSPSTAAANTSSASSSVPPPATSSSSAGSPVDYASKPDPADPTTAAVLKAYRAFSDVKVTMFNQARPTKQLAYVATGKVLQSLNDTTSRYWREGINYVGRPHSDPSVASISGDTATVKDCFGSMDWMPVYSSGADKGESALGPSSKPGAHFLTTTLQRFDGTWLVTDSEAKRDLC